MRIVIAILVFSVLILFHELGHFWFAKRSGIIVDEFSLGMGPRIISKEKNGTRYSLKAFPFGGSCAMRDEDGEDAEPGSFNAAPIWGRIAAVAAGPIFNFILAFVIAVIIIGVVGYDPPKVTAVEAGSPVVEAGLQEGDMITRFNGKRIAFGRDIANYELFNELRPEKITIEFTRDGVKNSLAYVPESVDIYRLGFAYPGESSLPAEITGVYPGTAMAKAGMQPNDIITGINGTTIKTAQGLSDYFVANPLTGEDVQLSFERNGNAKEATLTPIATTDVALGFNYNGDATGSVRVKATPLGVMKYALEEMRFWVDTTFASVKMLITGQVGINELSGPVGVVNVIGDAYEQSKEHGALVTWMSVLNIMLLLSVNLGIMNLLPLPALDGGRLIFLLLEALRGKPTNRRVEGMVHLVGIVLLLSLMAYVTFNDIFKLF